MTDHVIHFKGKRSNLQEEVEARQYERAYAIAEVITQENPITVGRCTFYPGAYAVSFDGHDLYLPKKEMLCCLLLASRPTWAFTRDQIADFIGNDLDTADRSIDTTVKRIRKRFKKIDPNYDPIFTIYNVGYRWQSDFSQRPTFKSSRVQYGDDDEMLVDVNALKSATLTVSKL